jgi:hypothetical protein
MARSRSRIRIKPSRKGSLRRIAGAKKGKPIPRATLLRLKKSKSAAVRRKATFALNARGWRKGGRR